MTSLIYELTFVILNIHVDLQSSFNSEDKMPFLFGFFALKFRVNI